MTPAPDTPLSLMRMALALLDKRDEQASLCAIYLQTAIDAKTGDMPVRKADENCAWPTTGSLAVSPSAVAPLGIVRHSGTDHRVLSHCGRVGSNCARDIALTRVIASRSPRKN